MIHKLLAGKGKTKRGLSLLLCLALLGCSVISSNVTAEAESDVATVETVENSETEEETTSETAEEAAVVSEETTLEDAAVPDTTETSEETGTEVAENPAEDTSGEGTLVISLSDGTDTDEQSSNTDGTSNTDSNDGIMLTAGGGGGGHDGGGQGENSNPSKISVFYDTVTVGSDDKTLTAKNSSTGIESVTMDGSTVPHGNGGSGNNSNGLSYSMTYGGDNTATIVITPSTGYYVTFVSVNCCGSGAATSCTTYGDGGAFTANFTIDSSGTITLYVPLDSEAGFHHNSNNSTYFILIHVSPVPSPLYVQYEYGNVTDFLSDVTGTVFADPDAWTDTDSRNNMVNSSTTGGGVVTDDTQYKYTYATGSESDASSWTHYANSITSEAEALAASYGYYFAGWEVTYYTDCTDFSFSGVYGSGSSYYQEGANVPLITHVKLVAVWVKADVTPGTLTISKSISGIDTTLVSSITFTVTDVSGETVDTVTLSTNNNWTASIPSITPGNYTVTESGYEVTNYNCVASVDGTDLDGYSATVTVTSGDVQSTLGYDGLYSYSVVTNNAEVAFTNTYSETTTNVTVTKSWADNNNEYGIRPNSVTVHLLKNEEQYTVGETEYTEQLSESNSWSHIWTDLPIYDDDGEQIRWTVSEDMVTYYTTTSPVVDESVTEGIGYIITNTLNTTDVTVIKNVTGNMGDTTKTFTFTYGVNAGSATIVNNNSFDLLDYDTNEYDSEVIGGVPVGATIILTEINGSGYSTSVSYSNGSVSEDDGVYTITIAEGEKQVITVTNDKTAIPDTGINLDSAPYILMLAGVAVLGGVVLFRRRRRLL